MFLCFGAEDIGFVVSALLFISCVTLNKLPTLSLTYKKRIINMLNQRIDVRAKNQVKCLL